MTNPKAGRRLTTIVSLAAAALVIACDGTPVEPAEALLTKQSSRFTDAEHACRNGRYSSLRRADGSSFKNAGECVSYASSGGTFIFR